jgi:hypothetical protein
MAAEEADRSRWADCHLLQGIGANGCGGVSLGRHMSTWIGCEMCRWAAHAVQSSREANLGLVF